MPAGVLAAAFLFNLGQGVLRPSLPLYLQSTFRANYRLVTAIPTVFGLGKWLASVPTGLAIDRIGRRPLMAFGLLIVALCDVTCVLTTDARLFLALRGLAGVGWAIFGTAATTTMVDVRGASQRGRAVSLLHMSETLGLFIGSLSGGWLYVNAGATSPFLFEAGCMVLGSVAVAGTTATMEHVASASSAASDAPPPASGRLAAVLRVPGVVTVSLTSAVLTAVQTGLIIFLFPVYASERAGVGPEGVGLLVSVGVLGRLAALWLGGGAADREQRLGLLVPGLIAYGALLACLGAVANSVTLTLWSAATGGAAGLVVALPAASIGDLAPPELRGVAIGWFRTVTDTGQIAGPLGLGTLADTLGLPPTFGAGAALLLAAAWLCQRLRKMPNQAGAPRVR